jgi:hypothetical protein
MKLMNAKSLNYNGSINVKGYLGKSFLSLKLLRISAKLSGPKWMLWQGVFII